MPKYRIKTTFSDGYQIQRRVWLLSWMTVEIDWTENYKTSKKLLEKWQRHDKLAKAYRKDKKRFKSKYYYPPLPDEEPV